MGTPRGLRSEPARDADPENAAVAERVRTFYEAHTYPPPEDDLERVRHRWEDPGRRRTSYHLCWPHEPFRDDRSVLVAGCGTSQAAKYALRWPQASVTGIDVSASSLAHARRLKERHGLENLELVDLGVERAPELGRTFDLVVCTGVLHHLPDPEAGFRALRAVLAPGGAFHVMVYAPYGRAGIYLIQEYARVLGLGASGEEIGDLATTLQSLPETHPLAPLLRSAPDFETAEGIADALLNPQDRPYSVPQLMTTLRETGFRFGRWLRQAPYLPTCGAPLLTPHQSRLAALPEASRYAAMELFRGSMLRHSAIAHGEGDDPEATAVDFGGDRWLDYVPLRMPETICVEERIPPTAAGVLINQQHTDRDIYLPIDARQKAWFDAIDGTRSIASIIQDRSDPADEVRTFFERLWHYDQIVVAS